MNTRTELTLNDGRRFKFHMRDGHFVSVYRVYSRPTLVAGEYVPVFDDYRSISANDKRREAIERDLRAAIAKAKG